MYIYIYIYVCVCVCVWVCIYIYMSPDPCIHLYSAFGPYTFETTASASEQYSGLLCKPSIVKHISRPDQLGDLG